GAGGQPPVVCFLSPFCSSVLIKTGQCDGAIQGSPSCPRTLRHTDGSDWGSNCRPLYPSSTAALVFPSLRLGRGSEEGRGREETQRLGGDLTQKDQMLGLPRRPCFFFFFLAFISTASPSLPLLSQGLSALTQQAVDTELFP
ncbi:unnamed protein product, partial [Pleuronectes platessa]